MDKSCLHHVIYFFFLQALQSTFFDWFNILNYHTIGLVIELNLNKGIVEWKLFIMNEIIVCIRCADGLLAYEMWVVASVDVI